MRFYCVKVAAEGRTLGYSETTWAGTREEAAALFRQETTVKGEITERRTVELWRVDYPTHKEALVILANGDGLKWANLAPDGNAELLNTWKSRPEAVEGATDES